MGPYWGRGGRTGSQLSSERGKEDRIYLENRAAAQPRQAPHCTTSSTLKALEAQYLSEASFCNNLLIVKN